MRVPTTIFCLGLLFAAEAFAADQRADQPRPQAPPPKISEDRFYALGDAAKESFDEGKIDDARKFAQELLTAVPHFKGNWNYGNALQDSHLVLGRIAVRENRIEEAKRHLYESAKSAGSPQMNTFGPDMSLAKDLVERGERQAVLDHFDRCRKFWKMHDGRLDKWAGQVQAGKIPNFGFEFD
jgi:hypothetical protein